MISACHNVNSNVYETQFLGVAQSHQTRVCETSRLKTWRRGATNSNLRRLEC